MVYYASEGSLSEFKEIKRTNILEFFQFLTYKIKAIKKQQQELKIAQTKR